MLLITRTAVAAAAAAVNGTWVEAPYMGSPFKITYQHEASDNSVSLVELLGEPLSALDRQQVGKDTVGEYIDLGNGNITITFGLAGWTLVDALPPAWAKTDRVVAVGPGDFDEAVTIPVEHVITGGGYHLDDDQVELEPKIWRNGPDGSTWRVAGHVNAECELTLSALSVWQKWLP